MAYDVFMDGWDRTEGDPGRMWVAYSGAAVIVNPTAGRRDTPCLEREYGAAADDWIRSVLFTPSAKVTLGLAIYLTGGEQSIELRLAHNWGRQIAVKISDFGLYSIIDGSGVDIWTSSDTLPLNAWAHLEFAVFCDAAGSYELRVNGIVKAYDASHDTQSVGSSLINSIYIGWDGPGDTGCLIDDLFFLYGDELKFIGDCRVDTLPLVANATPQDWGRNPAETPAEDAYTLLNQDAGSIYAIANDAESIFEVDDLTHAAYYVYGVQVVTRAGKTDAGTAAMVLELESGATVAESEQIGLTTSKLTYWESWPNNPDGDTAWTLGTVNAANVGVKSVAL
jgi:hypothetical protein